MSNLERDLKELVAVVERPPSNQTDEVASSLARFLVVRSCGFLEQVVVECCTSYMLAKSAPKVAAYGASWITNGVNPRPDRLISLVRRFDGGWGDDLQALFEAEDHLLSREISFLVDRRNKIAHGLAERIGARKALDLVSYSHQVADWFVVHLDPR